MNYLSLLYSILYIARVSLFLQVFLSLFTYEITVKPNVICIPDSSERNAVPMVEAKKPFLFSELYSSCPLK